ncbi:peptidoglycan-binding protein [Companilactobacillus paralimentarius]|uniref:peptidoglycan-binding protein n=1 Tax=Companilactobacillus paralimentarius TaxID=83526 RepID=UPI0037E075B6
MSKRFKIAFVCGLALLMMSPQSVKADTTNTSKIDSQAIVNTKSITNLYTEDGKLIQNQKLGANTAWVTDQKLTYQGQTYYRVATNEYIAAGDVTISYGHAKSGIVAINDWGGVSFSHDDNGFYRNGQKNFVANSLWKYDQVDQSGGLTYYRIGNDIWVNSNDATIAVGYQNPSGWFQIQNTQIKPVGNVGYDLYNGVEGVKVYLVRKYFGYSNTHTIYDSSIAASVKSFQARRGLPVTGVVNLATWKNMGFSESSWYSLDSYVAPLETNQTSTRSDHIEAMINQAYKYLGQTWISGAASSPQYGVDCSGLGTQALYASGINPAPVSAIQHAQVGNEWNSRMLWSDNRMPKVDFNNRQRGDLIFYTDPSTGLIWHVGILLNRDTMIESWPYAVQVHSIYSGRGNIAGVKRVFA